MAVWKPMKIFINDKEVNATIHTIYSEKIYNKVRLVLYPKKITIDTDKNIIDIQTEVNDG